MRGIKGKVVCLAAAVFASSCGQNTREEGLQTGLSLEEAAKILRPEAGWLVDGDGRVALLHGVNIVWKRPPYYAPSRPEGVTAADADFIRDQGFSVVRLGLIFAGVSPQGPGLIDEGYLSQIESQVELLWSRGIYVMLDFHQDMYHERFQGEGFPTWAVLDDGIPALPRLGFPYNYLGMFALNRAFDRFWENRSVRNMRLWDAYSAGWAAVATRFRSHPAIIGYNVMNEPWPGTRGPLCLLPNGCQEFDRTTLQSMHERVEAAIRTTGAKQAVFYEPNPGFNGGSASGLWTERRPPNDGSARGFSFHAYCLTDGLPPRTVTDVICQLTDDRVFRMAHEVAARGNAVPFLTEFGSTDDAAALRRMSDFADEYLVGWTYWAYKLFNDPTTSGGTSQGLFENDGDLSTLKPAKADVLIRPHARWVAGTPQSMGFDSNTRQFRLRYLANRAPGKSTVVYVPRRHYPCGYDVDTVGAQVTSMPGTQELVLQAFSTNAQVNVTLTPKACP
jgi:endoglycosylceramidase